MEFGLGTRLVDDEDLLEDGLVEVAAHLVGCFEVELVGVTKEFEPASNEVDAGRDVVFDGGEACLESGSFPFDLGDLLSCLRSGQAAVCDEVDEVVDTGLKARDLSLKLFAQLALGSGLVLEYLLDLLLHALDELRLQSHGPVVLDYLVFDGVEGEVAGVADAFLPAAAEEVEVLVAAFADGALDDHPLVGEPAHGVALAAPEGAFEVVRVDALAFAGSTGGREALLDALEQRPIDECGVSSLVGLAPVDDVADVVRVAEHPGDLGT